MSLEEHDIAARARRDSNLPPPDDAVEEEIYVWQWVPAVAGLVTAVIALYLGVNPPIAAIFLVIGVCITVGWALSRHLTYT